MENKGSKWTRTQRLFLCTRTFMRIYGSKEGLLNDRINSHFLPFTRHLILRRAARVPALAPSPVARTFMPIPARAISTTAGINRRACRLTSKTAPASPPPASEPPSLKYRWENARQNCR